MVTPLSSLITDIFVDLCFVNCGLSLPFIFATSEVSNMNVVTLCNSSFKCILNHIIFYQLDKELVYCGMMRCIICFIFS